MDPADNVDRIAWVRSAWTDISGLRGFADEESRAFGRNLGRLAEVKAIYDPDNFFSLNENVAPAVPP